MYDGHVESMMVVGSRKEEPHHHGGMFCSVSGHPTLPEKGWEGGRIFDQHATGGRPDIVCMDTLMINESQNLCTPPLGPNLPTIILGTDRTAHAACLGAAESVESVQCVCDVQCKLDCVHSQVSSKVEPVLDTSADLRKVGMITRKDTLEKSPSLVEGLVERFQSAEALLPEWDKLEGNESEWEEVGGMRRGGRKVSRRMSELLGRFEMGRGEEETVKMVDMEASVNRGTVRKLSSNFDRKNCPEEYFENFQCEGPGKARKPSFGVNTKYPISSPQLMPQKTKTNNINLVNNDVSKYLVPVCSEMRSKACDWLSNKRTSMFAANEKPASRKRDRELENVILDSRQIKKQRP